MKKHNPSTGTKPSFNLSDFDSIGSNYAQTLINHLQMLVMKFEGKYQRIYAKHK